MAENEKNKETLYSVMDKMVRYGQLNTRTSFPGAITGFDPSKQTAQVQPLIKALMGNGDEVALPVLLDVPVLFPRAGGFSITFPVTPSKKSTVQVQLVGTQGTEVPAGTAIANAIGDRFQIKNDTTIGAGPTETLAESEDLGPIPVDASTVNVIVDAVTGWTSVNNDEDGTEGKIGDEVLVTCCDRDFSTWFQQGGQQMPDSNELHSLSSAVAVLGLYNQTNVISSFDTTSMVLRSDDDATKITISDGIITVDAAALAVNAPTTVWTGNITHAGNVTQVGNYTQTGGLMMSNGIIASEHVHTGVTAGGALTGNPAV